MYLMGVQCSGTVQPVFGRSPLFQQNGNVFQTNSSNSSNSSNEIGISASSASLVGNGSTAFHHLNGSANSSVAPSPVHLHHQLNVTNNQSNGLGSLTNGLSNGLNSNNHRENNSNNGKLHNSSLMRNGSLNNSNVLLDYFPTACNDGLNISWCHGVNSRARLNYALSSKFFKQN